MFYFLSISTSLVLITGTLSTCNRHLKLLSTLDTIILCLQFLLLIRKQCFIYSRYVSAIIVAFYIFHLIVYERKIEIRLYTVQETNIITKTINSYTRYAHVSGFICRNPSGRNQKTGCCRSAIDKIVYICFLFCVQPHFNLSFNVFL